MRHSRRARVSSADALRRIARLSVVLLASVLLVVTIAGCTTPAEQRRGATPLVPERPHQGFLIGGEDWFVFTLPAPSRVVLESHTAIASIQTTRPDGRLVDAEGRVRARDWRSGEDENFRIDTKLPAGTWYLVVSNGTACITLHSCAELDPAYRVSLEVMAPEN